MQPRYASRCRRRRAALYAALTLSAFTTNSWLYGARLAKPPRPCMQRTNSEESYEIVWFGVFWPLLCIADRRSSTGPTPDNARPRSIPPIRSRPVRCVPGPSFRQPNSRPIPRRRWRRSWLDQQVRDVDIGKAHIGIGMVHRGKLDKPAPDFVAEHDQISEVYHIVSGTGTLVLGPDIVNRQRRPATMRTVVEFNGPGNNGSEVRNGVAYELKAGDVVVIPAGTGPLVHQDRRPPRLPDGADRSRQGLAAQERGPVEGLPVEAGPPRRVSRA